MNFFFVNFAMLKIDENKYYKLFKLSIIAKIYKVETANGKRDTLIHERLEPMFRDHPGHRFTGSLLDHLRAHKRRIPG